MSEQDEPTEQEEIEVLQEIQGLVAKGLVTIEPPRNPWDMPVVRLTAAGWKVVEGR